MEFHTVIKTDQPGFSDFYQLLHMFVRQGQAQHWMKIINWKNPERSLELQLGDQSTDLLYDQAWAITK